MNYFIFGHNIHPSDKPPDPLSPSHVCIVDVDVLIASASETALDKKDGILAKKFSAVYEGNYCLQDEKISANLFQVMGIKSEKVKEVYARIPSENVVSLVPYAAAVRTFLASRHVPTDRLIVFLDDLGTEKFITVFEGLKFSRTRTLFEENPQQLLSEIKRSIINFEKKLADQKDNNDNAYIVITNNRILTLELRELEQGLKAETVDSVYPAIDGLKAGAFNFKYVLPEDIIKKRRHQEHQRWIRSLALSASILAAGVFFYAYNRINLGVIQAALNKEQARQSYLEAGLNQLDPFIYRSMLERQKSLNYAFVFQAIEDFLPASYETYTFELHRRESHWSLEEYLYTADDQFYDTIVPAGPLKSVLIKDFWVNNKPGKYLRIDI